ncbi:MAG: amino acid ABC transporter substrate-binding protein [Paraglaciecola sp.]|nr:amino acid ABC transporter substrate-binding protein [Paraglaciecola sp.]NCT47487.1 amino acid ABC transporter substrate-binding protein [Paraglaciecola sp.]
MAVKSSGAVFSLFIVLSLSLSGWVAATESAPAANPVTVRLWQDNYNNEAVRSFVELALTKAEQQYGPYTLQASAVPNLDAAFVALRANDYLDLVVSGLAAHREEVNLPVYIPLDRGLLGFRACMIKPQNEKRFALVESVDDFARSEILTGLVSAWPDVAVMEANSAPVVKREEYEQLIGLLKNDKISCFSRSLLEIKGELLQRFDLIEEQRLALIYPLADIIYVSPALPELHARIEYGLREAIADRSFYELFNRYYGNVLQEHQLYFRKVLVLKNPAISAAGLRAINQFGVASFKTSVY